MISCFETVTQDVLGQPFCNMSMEALEMMVRDDQKSRPAKSGEGYKYMCVCIELL